MISAILVAVIFPEVFTNSHPVPGPLGSTVLLGTILVFLMGDAWRSDEGVDAERPMVLHVLFLFMLLALMVTHHMSHFFLILVLGMSYLLRKAMVVGREPGRDWWGSWTMISALALATVYWLVVAEVFREEVMVDLAGVDGYVMMAVAWVALMFLMIIAAVLGRYRTKVPNPPMWGVPELRPALVAYLFVGVAIIVLVSVYGFPGTDIEPGGEMIVYILPTMAAFALLIGSSDVVLRRHGGIVAVAWVAALTGSFLLMTALQSHILVPYRHIPYLVEGLAVLAGIGGIHLIVMFRPEVVPRVKYMAPMVIIGIILLASLVYTTYPTKSVMGGFQEGTTEQELGASLWLRGGLPVPGGVPEDLGSGTVATDHRMSSVAFGIGGQMATWDRGGPVLHGVLGDELWDALEDMDTPYGDRPVSAVVLSEDFRTGAALSQFSSSRPVEGEAWDKFFDLPFYTVYDGGDVWVMVVVRPLDTTG